MVGIIFAKEITSRIAMTVSIETKNPWCQRKKIKVTNVWLYETLKY